MRLEKKKNLVSRVKNVTWQLVSRVQKCDLATSFQGRFCALETRYEHGKKTYEHMGTWEEKKISSCQVEFLLWQLVARSEKN